MTSSRDEDELKRRWAPTLGQRGSAGAPDQHTQYATEFAEYLKHLKENAAEFSRTFRDDDENPGKWPSETIQQDTDAQFQSQSENWEEAVDNAADGPHTGVMVALYPPPDVAQKLALDDGEDPEDLHCTLAYLGEAGADIPDDAEPDLVNTVRQWATTQQPFSGQVNGIGMFSNPEKVTYANLDSPALPAVRQSLVDHLGQAGFGAMQTHGYTPHITLMYGDARDQVPDPHQMNFGHVVVAFAGNQTKIPLLGQSKPPAAAPQQAGYQYPYPYSTGTSPAITHGGSWTLPSSSGWTVNTSSLIVNNGIPAASPIVTDRPAAPVFGQPMTPQPPAEVQGMPDVARAFVTDIGGKTLITGPATTIAAFKEPTVEDITSQHMLWMHGKFVGADEPNRNGAYWSSGDLEMAKGTVTHGPLNWLHEARHVIGTLAKADYVKPQQLAAAGRPGTHGTGRPHITATAAVWKWIYPDEAYVVEQASDLQQLWYSMECISKQVECSGENGCGNITSYADYMNGAACEHVKERASVRRFKDPVFLGGAVIVPPTRPGWAEADARVMNSANRLAEAAFEQAGKPDVPASAWEQLMAQLVRFAQQ